MLRVSLQTLLCCLLFVSAASAKAPVLAADARLTDLRGKAVYPLRHPSENYSVFLFVRTDCPISNSYAPKIARLYEEYAGRRVAFWLVYTDSSETPDAIETHLKTYNLPLRALSDPRHELVRSSNVTVTPEAAVFDRDGTLVYHGRIDDEFAGIGVRRTVPTKRDLKETLQRLLDGKPLPTATTPAVGCFIEDDE